MSPSLAAQVRAETWASPAGFASYEVSDQGRVRNVSTGRVLTPRMGNRGYWRLNLRGDDGRVVTRHVHVLVAAAHLGPRPHGMEICHGRGGKERNWVENLRYDTPEANRWDRWGKPRSRWSRTVRAAWAEWRRLP